jgi:hypothetical protein
LATTPSRALGLGLKAFGIDWEDQERLKNTHIAVLQVKKKFRNLVTILVGYASYFQTGMGIPNRTGPVAAGISDPCLL